MQAHSWRAPSPNTWIPFQHLVIPSSSPPYLSTGREWGSPSSSNGRRIPFCVIPPIDAAHRVVYEIDPCDRSRDREDKGEACHALSSCDRLVITQIRFEILVLSVVFQFKYFHECRFCHFLVNECRSPQTTYLACEWILILFSLRFGLSLGIRRVSGFDLNLCCDEWW
jgi:hypothetical protein